MKLTKDDPEFYSKISQMRKKKSGGMYFKDKEKAREAQQRGVATKLRKAAERAEGKASQA
jgi:general stress protein YciG